MKKLLFLLFMAPVLAVGQENDWQWNPTDYPPMYYKETPFGYERLDSLPVVRITLHDTVYISDIDAFLQTYIADKTDINALLKDIDGLRSLLDSLDGLRGERLYYNFFMHADTLRRMSDSFIVRELGVDDNLATHTSAVREPGRSIARSARREIMLRIDGGERTDRFVRDKNAIRKALSRLFADMQRDSAGIRGIDLYFPDYDFTRRRDMAQLVKSVRIMMDASRDFKFGPTTLRVFFHAGPDGRDRHRDLLYSLGQEASAVVLLDDHAPGNPFLSAREITAADHDDTGLMLKLRSHLLIARYYTGEIDIRTCRITDFAETNIAGILDADYLENSWETFLFILLSIVLMLVVFVVFYHSNAAFSLFVSRHAESVLLALTVVVLEMGILAVTALQNMCGDDRLTIIERHPLVIFLLPLAVIPAAPLLHHILKNRKTP